MSIFGTRKRVTKDITAQNTFSDWLYIDPDDVIDVSISGTFVANVKVQRTFDGAANIRDVTTSTGADVTFTAPAEFQISGASRVGYRVGVKTGGYTSGTVSIVLQVK